MRLTHVLGDLDLTTNVSPETRLILKAFSTGPAISAGEQRDAVREAAASIEPTTLAALTGRHRIAVATIARLKDLGLVELASELSTLQQPRLEHARSSLTVQDVMTHALADELESQSIQSVALKGVALAQRIYGDAAARESQDIDLLVRPDQLDEAVSVLRTRFGYEAPLDAIDSDGRPLLHFHLDHLTGWPSIEVHWRVHWYEARSGAEMLRRSIEENGLRILSLVDELACLLLFYARDGFIGLRNLIAIAAWWDAFGAVLPAEGLSRFVTDYPQLGYALAASGSIAARLTGVPYERLAIPSAYLGQRQRHAARLVNVDDLGRPEIVAELSLVDLLLSPRLELRAFVRRQWLINESFVIQSGASRPDGPVRQRVAAVSRMLRRAGLMLRAFTRSRHVHGFN